MTSEATPNDHVLVTRDPLELEALSALVASPACGALASFVGTVRSPNLGEVVEHIDYEGYEPMILTQMRAIIAELHARFELGGVVMAHRLGRLTPGEASIVIVVAAPHRRDALDACQAAIEAAKVRLPIWKREATEAGAHWVEGSSAAGITL